MTYPDIGNRIQQRALIVGVVGLVLTGVGYFTNSQQFFESYLLAILDWTAIAIGSLALLMLYHLTGGEWGFVTRRMLESATRTFPLLGLFFLPILMGTKSLYLWADPEKVKLDVVLVHKSAYLNVPGFIGRTIFYFVTWSVMALLLSKWSAEQDHTADPAPAKRLLYLSAPGIPVLGLTVTFAAIDWIMSLEPKWYSTIYGVWYLIGGVLAALAFMIVAARIFSQYPPMDQVYKPSHFHDLGNLMLAFVMLWAYVSFSQFLIIWSGNLPEETPFYVKRLGEGWQTIALMLVLFHFALPFLVLLSRDVKRKIERLSTLAIGMLFMRYLDLFWVVRPSWGGPPHFHWLDLTTSAGIGGIWIAAFLWQLKVRPLLPVNNPQGEASF
jgi:hypothetical protein